MKRHHKLMVKLLSLVALASMALVFFQQFSSKKAVAETTTIYTDTTSDFISSIAGTASQIGQEYDLYASVLIAQAILESNSGRSSLSQFPHHNLFGIKGAYNGEHVVMQTWEDDGEGNPYQTDAAFRAYPSYTESLYDYANLLSRDLYAGTWKSNTSTYADATAALTGLYATDTSYADKLNSLIETYGLTAYDTVYEETSYAYVWNEHRRAYTDTETLALDDAWAALHQ